MKGIQFVVDDQGKQTAAIIYLRKHRELWEDFFHKLMVQQRADEPREPLESVKQGLRAQGKLKWVAGVSHDRTGQ